MLEKLQTIPMTKAVLDELHDGLLLKMFHAEQAQRVAARLGHERRNMENGFVKMAVQPEFYHYWGQRLGYECWEDKQFVHEYLRDNPAARVNSRSTKIMVGWRPSAQKWRARDKGFARAGAIAGTRSRKVYA